MPETNHLVKLHTDNEGFLKNLDDWCPIIAAQLAELESIKLDEAHWEVIHLLRKFYQRHRVSLANKALVNLVKQELGEEKGRSIYLLTLFRGHSKASPAVLAAKIAGLPRPDNCL